MEKIIASRHFDLDETTKGYVLEALAKLEADYHKLTSGRAVLDQQKTWYFVEFELRGKNLDIEAKSKAHELRVAIDEAAEKAHAQLRKYLDRVHDHNHVSVSALELKKGEQLAVEGGPLAIEETQV